MDVDPQSPMDADENFPDYYEYEDMEISSVAGTSSRPASIYSYSTSRDGAHLLREEHGRLVNNRNELYPLPSDDEEFERLDTQHAMLRMVLGGLYIAEDSVRRALAPTNSTRKAIIDIGAGGGNWAVDMAREFPHAEVVALDLAPAPTMDFVPENLRWEVDDANLEMPHYHSAFDVVHARAISHGIRDFPAFIQEASNMLRPGGVFLLVAGTLQLYNEERKPIGPNDSALQRVFFHAYNAQKARGSNVDSVHLMPEWMKGCKTLVNHTFQTVYIPLGSWIPGNSYEVRRWNHIGERFRDDALSFAKAFRPLLINEGFKADDVDEMIDNAVKEMKEMKVRLFSAWCYGAAEKPMTTGEDS